ncbi:MAG: hypothetical protein LBM98_09100 [Oscillospiraceae bacterium]|nr:hypothetical protein [Oscillospiraceae bacterium]
MKKTLSLLLAASLITLLLGACMGTPPNPNASPEPKDLDPTSLYNTVWSFQRAVRGGFEVTAVDQTELADYKFEFSDNSTVKVNGAKPVAYTTEGAYIDADGTKLMFDGKTLSFLIEDSEGSTRYYFAS